jgi:hypothetical protein
MDWSKCFVSAALPVGVLLAFFAAAYKVRPRLALMGDFLGEPHINVKGNNYNVPLRWSRSWRKLDTSLNTL